MCCLKRPFDEQAQPRVRLESEAVLAMLASESATRRFIRSEAHVLENSFNPVKSRAAKVEHWLREGPGSVLEPARLQSRTAEILALGFKSFDALHLASAELGGATLFGTCDDKLLANARRHSQQFSMRILGVIELSKEVLDEPSAS
jgi:hypothetical protein